MLPSIFDLMAASGSPEARPADTLALTRSASASTDPDSEHSGLTVTSSTPPTSHADSASVSSTADAKMDVEAAAVAEPAAAAADTARPRRARTSVASYNVKVLSGTAVHVPKKFLRQPPAESRSQNTPVATRRRTIAGDLRLPATPDAKPRPWGKARRTKSTGALEVDVDVAADVDVDVDMDLSVSTPSVSPTRGTDDRRSSARLSGRKVETLTERLSVLGKRGRKAFEAGLTKKRELRNLADTNEFAHIDSKPVRHEVWSRGKLVVEDEEPPPKRSRSAAKKAAEDAARAEREKHAPREKGWLVKGLYAGQQVREKTISLYHALPESTRYQLPKYRPSGLMPLPMWHGERMIHLGRDFKLPFDVCSPLPPGQPKPDEWRKTTRNRFIGDSAATWKKSTLFDDFSSRCICGPKGGCDEDCQNRIMLYECDDQNCSAGRDRCSNRAFSELQERRKAGGVYRIGVEVIKTSDRGYGVRSNRCFRANQIIVEYTGEIINEEECDRRMNEDYKHNECYYLMSFDQNMIIDATRGSIARFVNHSCEPNCRMVKWIVAGQPRMALFAGDRDIMTGEELTYDYNFDPFSAKNVQKCLCGSSNCRGVLGPRPKVEIKKVEPKPTLVRRRAGRKLKIARMTAAAPKRRGRPPKAVVASQTTVRKTLTGRGARAARATRVAARTTVRAATSATAASPRKTVRRRQTKVGRGGWRTVAVKTTTTTTTTSRARGGGGLQRVSAELAKSLRAARN